MPRTSSAQKELRKNARKRVRNIAQKTAVKAAMKKLNAAQDFSSKKEELSHVYASLDKAAKKHTMHKNKAARLKSRLAKKLNASSK
ncbi:MAG: 30S ribosomal protein S20 [Patescibacteria group bacterium]|nr:30S ribosomal protein S20 [Patescibacteria group bacterium]MDE2438465.1 30S ribosomal protein S20 [Patescibacteria group bacterium]